MYLLCKNTSLCKKIGILIQKVSTRNSTFEHFTSQDAMQVRDAIILRKTFEARKCSSCLVPLSHSVSQFTKSAIALE